MLIVPLFGLLYWNGMRSIDRFHVSRADLFQFGKYFIGGASYFWSGYAVFAVCYSGFGWDWFPSKMLGDVVGWSVNYALQRYWAFASSRLKRHEGATVGKYAAITAINLVLDYLIMWGLKHIGITPYVGFFISAAFFTAWNYAWYRLWVFYAAARVEKLSKEAHV